jgi:hypothetical protein
MRCKVRRETEARDGSFHGIARLGRLAVLRATRSYRLHLMREGLSPSLAAACALTRARTA